MSKRADQEVQRRLQELSAIEASLVAKLGSDGLLCLCLDAAVWIHDIQRATSCNAKKAHSIGNNCSRGQAQELGFCLHTAAAWV